MIFNAIKTTSNGTRAIRNMRCMTNNVKSGRHDLSRSVKEGEAFPKKNPFFIHDVCLSFILAKLICSNRTYAFVA